MLYVPSWYFVQHKIVISCVLHNLIFCKTEYSICYILLGFHTDAKENSYVFIQLTCLEMIGIHGTKCSTKTKNVAQRQNSLTSVVQCSVNLSWSSMDHIYEVSFWIKLKMYSVQRIVAVSQLQKTPLLSSWPCTSTPLPTLLPRSASLHHLHHLHQLDHLHDLLPSLTFSLSSPSSPYVAPNPHSGTQRCSSGPGKKIFQSKHSSCFSIDWSATFQWASKGTRVWGEHSIS